VQPDSTNTHNFGRIRERYALQGIRASRGAQSDLLQLELSLHKAAARAKTESPLTTSSSLASLTRDPSFSMLLSSVGLEASPGMLGVGAAWPRPGSWEPPTSPPAEVKSTPYTLFFRGNLQHQYAPLVLTFCINYLFVGTRGASCQLQPLRSLIKLSTIKLLSSSSSLLPLLPACLKSRESHSGGPKLCTFGGI
jgi:hypothetical protein